MIAPSSSPLRAKAVSGICTYLHRAYRDLRFYPPDHPMARQTVEALTQTLVDNVDKHGVLVLEVGQDRLLWEGEQVYAYDTSRDNLAFIMFRDGVRLLTFHPGLEASEIEALVGCLARADDLADVEHDLLTAFWEQDFAHIDYQAVDPFLSGEVLQEGTVDALRETVRRRLDEVHLSDEGGEPLQADLQVVELKETDLSSFTLSSEEAELGEKAAEHAPDTLRDFALVLVEILGSPEGSATDSETLSGPLVMVLESFLDSRDLDELEFLIGGLQQLETEGRCPPGFVGAVAGQAMSAARLGGLVAGGGTTPADQMARWERLLRSVRNWVFPAMLELLAESQDRGVRRSLLSVLREGEGVPGKHLERLMGDPRWYVVRNAVQLAAGVRDSAMIDSLERLLTHPDVRVRREATRTLETIGGAAALTAVVKAFSDMDASVRALAAGSIGRLGGPEQEFLLRARVQGADFESGPPEEVEAVLLALARVGGDNVAPLLDRMWRSKRFRGRPLATRLAAVRALGAIPGVAAQSILVEAAKSGDEQVRRAAVRAMQEARYLKSGRPHD